MVAGTDEIKICIIVEKAAVRTIGCSKLSLSISFLLVLWKHQVNILIFYTFMIFCPFSPVINMDIQLFKFFQKEL